MATTKPHYGRIDRWFKSEIGTSHIIRGVALDHPQFANAPGFHTSAVISHDEATGEIETRNSRYTLVGKAVR